jgi:hypothetical protein
MEFTKCIEITDLENTLSNKQSQQNQHKQKIKNKNQINININTNMISKKTLILKSLCDNTIEPIKQVIEHNFSGNNIVNEGIILSIFSFIRYTNIKLVDMSIFNIPNDPLEYCDIIMEYNYQDKIYYIRWFEEVINFKLVPVINNINNMSPDFKRDKIFKLVDKYLTKFFLAQVFNNLDETYDYLKFNCINRNNKKILDKLKKNQTINDLVTNKRDTNIFELLEITYSHILSQQEISDLDNYLQKNIQNKRKKIQYKKNIYTYQYYWYEIGSLIILMNDYISKL